MRGRRRGDVGVLHLGLRSVFRRGSQTALTVIGVSLATATYLLLVSISASFVREIQSTVNMLGSDVTVQQLGSGFPELSWVPEERLDQLQSLAGVEGGFSVAISVARMAGDRYFVVLGVGPEIPLLQGMRLLEGQLPSAAGNEIALGFRAARALAVTAGHEVELKRRPLKVVGVYESGRSLLDRGAVLHLAAHQEIFDIGNRVNLMFLGIDERANPSRIRQEIDSAFADLEAVPTDHLTAHYGQVDEISTLVGRIALVALLIAALGVSNVMLISVSRRTEEFGVLRAVGWRKQDLFAVMLVQGGVVGALGGVAAVPIAQLVLMILSGMDTIGYTPGAVPLAACYRGVVLSGLAGALGCLPAATRILSVDPTRALRGD